MRLETRFNTCALSQNDPLNYHKYMKLNQIYHGDNLHFMKDMPSEFIDLIYIDPPFGTQSLWSSKAWKGQKVQEMSFYDSWGGGIHGYLNFITERLTEMHRLLKPTGSIFVHLDWRVAHYVKIEMDKIFGVDNPASRNTNFINEIVWCYSGGGASKKWFSKKHDTILFYAKDKNKYKFNVQKIPRTEKSLKRLDNPNGARVNKNTMKDWDKRSCLDWWEDIQVINPMGKERIGYPTQKPRSLLERIIKSTTNQNDIVVDFFCGCGTTIDAAQSLDRQWLGFDASETACEVMCKRMMDRHSLVVGLERKPVTYEQFMELEPFDFEKETVRHIGGVANTKQVSDGGVDGRLAFDGTPIQVKKSKRIGRNVLDNFHKHMSSHGRGIVIALSFGKGAKQEANRLRREENVDIQLLTLKNVVDGKFRERPLAAA